METTLRQNKTIWGRLDILEQPLGEFDQICAHDVNVVGEVMDDDCILFLFNDYLTGNPKRQFRLTVYAKRGRWPWSKPVLGYVWEENY